MLFQVHKVDTAPEKSRPLLQGLQEQAGFIPNMLAVMAESPAALAGWMQMNQSYGQTSFNAAERKVVELTASHLNSCAYCIAAGTTFAEYEGVPREVLDDLRNDRKLKDDRLEALRQFTKTLMRSMGRPNQPSIDAFIRAGYTTAQVLEVVMGVTLAIFSNYVNHIIDPQLDKGFEHNRIDLRRVSPKQSDVA